MAACVVVGGLSAGTAAAADGTALLRLAHLSPDTPDVDVALAPLPDDGAPLTDPGPDVETGLGYGGVGDFREVAAGRYALSVRAAGTGSDTPPSLSVRVDLAPGAARTVVLSGRFADLSLEVLADDLSAPGPASARVRVLAGAAGAPIVDVTTTAGTALADDLPFGAAGPPVAVPAGPSGIRVAGGPAAARITPLDLPAGSVTSLVLLDDPDGGLSVRVVLDAAGPGTVPVGPVAAGQGGAAGSAPLLASAAITAGGALALAGRRRTILVSVAALCSATAAPGAAAAGEPPSAERTPVFLSVVREGAPSGVVPSRLRIPSAGIDTALTAVGLGADGALAPPADPDAAGWYRQGPAPGSPGPAVITGHVDSTSGPGVFFPLRQVDVGDDLLVDRADGTTVRFTVTRVLSSAKGAFPTDQVYGPTPGAELRLITCGGAFDRATGSYRDNVVVFAAATR